MELEDSATSLRRPREALKDEATQPMKRLRNDGAAAVTEESEEENLRQERVKLQTEVKTFHVCQSDA